MASHEEVLREARYYGEQVRLAEDDNLQATRTANREAWEELLDDLRGTNLEIPARDSYWGGYLNYEPVIVIKE